jgi:hypothetical protein
MSAELEPREESDDPWDILPEETSRAYEAFNAFLTLGPTRTRKGAAEVLGVSPTTLREWYGRHSWEDRARAYDVERQRVLRTEIEAETLEMRKRHAGIAVFMQKKVAERLSIMDAAELTPKDSVYMMDLASKLERISRGANEPTKVELTGAGGGPIEIAESLGAQDRAALMAKVQAELAKRLAAPGGSPQEALEGVFDAEVVEDE